MRDVDIHGTGLLHKSGLGFGSVFVKVYGANWVMVRVKVRL